MADQLNDILARAPVVPLVQADDPAVAVAISRALAAGGLTVIEVVLRTERALDCLEAIGEELPEVIAGAGTVLSRAQAGDSLERVVDFMRHAGNQHPQRGHLIRLDQLLLVLSFFLLSPFKLRDIVD